MPRAVILTALQVEYLAVRKNLTHLQEITHDRGTIYEQGKFAARDRIWDVGIAEIGAGNPGAALEAERAIAHFSPDVILFVGVAGGIKDVAVGDVVASTKVYGYESGKAEETFKPRPEIGLAAYGLEQRARAEARKGDWLDRILTTPPHPRVFVAPIAAGEKVIASKQSDVYQFLQSHYGDAVAVEMEGFGFLEVARANQQVSAMVIRGISDLIDDKAQADGAGSQEIASSHASAFAFEILAKFQPEVKRGSEDRVNYNEESLKQDRSSVNSESNLTMTLTDSQHQLPFFNFFALDSSWVGGELGRGRLVKELSEKLRNSCRLLMILGLTGIGKTALAERIAIELQDCFGEDWSKNTQRANFDYQENTTDFVSVATRWLNEWGIQLSPQESQPELVLQRLTQYLCENRTLIIIDSLEQLLGGNTSDESGKFIDIIWEQFLLKLLSAEICRSRIIITSQELPTSLANSKYRNFWYRQILYGLDETEQEALFETIGANNSSNLLSCSEPHETNRKLLLRLGKAYKGHPLVLRVIIGEICESFDRNVQAYWNEVGSKIEEVERTLTEAEQGQVIGQQDEWELHKLTREVREQVNKQRLEAVFNRLKQQAQKAYIMLCMAAIYRIPVQQEGWKVQLVNFVRRLKQQECNSEQQESAVDELRNRYLVEESVNHNNKRVLGQHNLVRSIALEHYRKLLESLKSQS
jgi:nucleoside phosphorylase